MSWRWIGRIAVAVALGAVVSALIAGLLVESHDRPTLRVPPWHEGDEVEYAGPTPLAFRVAGAASVLLPDARLWEGVAVVVDGEGTFDDRTQFVSLADGVLIADVVHCGSFRDGACAPLRLADWSVRAKPAMLGASAVAGRALRVGDVWNVSVPWSAPLGHVRVEVLPPAPGAPEGTVLTVDVSLGPGAGVSWRTPGGRMHLGEGHPYPLRVEVGNETYALAFLKRGARPVAETPALPPTFPLPTHEFREGRPHEGAPLEGHPAWAEARAAAGSPEVALCAEWEYVAQRHWSGDGEWYDYTLRETCRRAAGDWVRIEYQGTPPLAGTPLSDLVPRRWTRAETPVSEPPGAACAGRAPAAWDVVRRTIDSGLLRSFEGYKIVGECGSRIFLVTGPLPEPPQNGIGSGTTTSVNLDAATGWFRAAHFAAPTDALFG